MRRSPVSHMLVWERKLLPVLLQHAAWGPKARSKLMVARNALPIVTTCLLLWVTFAIVSFDR